MIFFQFLQHSLSGKADSFALSRPGSASGDNLGLTLRRLLHRFGLLRFDGFCSPNLALCLHYGVQIVAGDASLRDRHNRCKGNPVCHYKIGTAPEVSLKS